MEILASEFSIFHIIIIINVHNCCNFSNDSIDNFTSHSCIFHFFLPEIHIFLMKDGSTDWDIKAREIIMRWSFVVNEFEQGNKKKKRNKKKRKTSTMNLPFLNIIYCFIYCILSALPSFIALSGLCVRVILLLLNHVSSYKSGQRHSGGTSAVILCYLGADCTLNMKFLTAVNMCLRLITNCAMSWMQSLEKKISCFDI